MMRITQGSIFDVKCDLLVVPCDSGGGLASSVLSNLRAHGLPTRIGTIPFGNVYFRRGRYENASTIAYAAAVNAITASSSSEAVARIAWEIRGYCRNNSMLAVNFPLLGSGEGGMNPEDSYLALKDTLEDDTKTTYTIFCFTRDQFQNVSAAHDFTEQRTAAPRVFISYAGANAENAAWVKALAATLRQNGIDARLDVFHLKPGFDLPQWMTNEVILADKVLLICDRHYMQKADFRKGGVGWETMIIQGDMLAWGDNKQKYIAIIREAQVEKALPIYIRSKFALNWGRHEISDAQIQDLVLRLFDCDLEPDLGSVPGYVMSKLKRSRAAGKRD
jgi:hypothetical protein